MTRIEDDREAEEDPRTARIVRRMRLFVGISTAVMAVGFLTVMSVIVWRVVKQDTAAAAPAGELRAVLPVAAGSRIIDTTSDGKRLFVTVEDRDGRQAIHVFDAGTLAYRGRIDSLAP